MRSNVSSYKSGTPSNHYKFKKTPGVTPQSLERPGVSPASTIELSPEKERPIETRDSLFDRPVREYNETT